MATQYSIKLAISLISSHFGDLVAKVCECLLRKGSLTLADITRFTELPQAQVKNCLLVLIQHNCVQAFSIQIEGGVGAAPKVITQYTAIFDNILHRMRFPKFLAIVSEELDKECEEILEGLFQHGRLTLEQIILRAVSNQNEGNSTVQDAVRESFVRLVSSHYVERCPASEPFLAPPDEEENPTKKRAKSARLAEEIETLEKRAISAAAPLESERFAVITDTGTDVKSGDRSGSRFLDTAIGEKRKHEALEMDRETMATICEKEVLWRANFEAFIRRLRHKACVANVRARMDDGACTVLNAMLEATRNAESRIKTENSVPLSMDAILAEVMKSEGGRSMTVERVRAALGQLGCRSSPRGAEDSHSVDLRNIIEMAQNDEMESIVLKRYGRDAYRIFRLLSKTGRLVETDKISDITFVDKKEAPKILYNLWKDNYLHMEKLTSQGSKQSDFLLWKVNRSSLWKQILDEMCHAALNLSQRLAYEFEQEHEILQLPREKRVGAQGKRFERIRKVKLVLQESTLLIKCPTYLISDHRHRQHWSLATENPPVVFSDRGRVQFGCRGPFPFKMPESSVDGPKFG